MNELPARLIIKLGPNPGKEYSLTQTETTIGRSSGNTIVIQNPDVSRRHARIRREADKYSIEDWGSTNGTFVSGQRVMNLITLRDQDTIKLGDSIVLQFSIKHDVENAAASSSQFNPEDQATIVDTAPPQLVHKAATDEAHSSLQEEPLAADSDFILPHEARTKNRNRIRLFGCSCMVLLLPLLCIGVLVFLDFYQQGRLLYCGPIRPLFEILLGPLGFAPICP